jgi:excisionase family DNA binding protein
MVGKWLDPRGAGAHATVSESTILRAARSGRLKGYKVGSGKLWRFRVEDIDAWIMKTTTPVAFEPRRRDAR